MSLSDLHVAELSRGEAYSFSSWPNPSVPAFGAGVYTIWHNDGRFIYVGMSGRGITAETLRRNTPHGIYTRLRSHAPHRGDWTSETRNFGQNREVSSKFRLSIVR